MLHPSRYGGRGFGGAARSAALAALFGLDGGQTRATASGEAGGEHPASLAAFCFTQSYSVFTWLALTAAARRSVGLGGLQQAASRRSVVYSRPPAGPRWSTAGRQQALGGASAGRQQALGGASAGCAGAPESSEAPAHNQFHTSVSHRCRCCRGRLLARCKSVQAPSRAPGVVTQGDTSAVRTFKEKVQNLQRRARHVSP